MCHKSWSLPTWRLKIAMNVSCPPKKQLLKGDEKLRYFSKFGTPGINLCTHSFPTNGLNGQDSKCFQFWLKHAKVLKHSNLVYKPFKLSVSYDSHVYIYIYFGFPSRKFQEEKVGCRSLSEMVLQDALLESSLNFMEIGDCKTNRKLCSKAKQESFNRQRSTNLSGHIWVTGKDMVRMW